MGQFWLVKDKSQIKERVKFFEQWLNTDWDGTYPLKWEVSRYKAKRSLSQNALFHVWCREIAIFFTEKGHEVSEERMKELLCYKFLGTEDRVIGKTVIEAQVRETSNLPPGEMSDLLDQVLAWALDHGVKVSNPIDSEYAKLSSGGL
ncbi:recombination protein NinB [bacterium]|nr:recombination protein NinB [bacterium]